MRTSEILRRAGDISRERGWCQDEYTSQLGSHCAVGAIRAADERVFPAIVLLSVVADMPDPASGIADTGSTLRWNDAPGRTHAEVLIALDAAYVLALQEEGIEPEDVL